MDLKVPPHSQEAEESVLGAVMLSKDAITAAIEILKPEDFYSPAHSEIFSAVLAIYSRNEPADIVTVKEELNRRNILDEVGGITYLANLTSGVAAISNTEYYCRIIKEKSTLRKLINVSNDVMEKAFSPEAKADAIIEVAEKNIFDITQQSHRQGLIPINEVMLKSFHDIEERATNPEKLTGLTTGFIDLDNQLSGMQKSDLILLAARPSMGKTALMVNIATNAAIKGKAVVAMFSLEMSKEQLVQRIISSMAHVDLQKVISGNLNEDEWFKILTRLNP